jgi:hypothetical protein
MISFSPGYSSFLSPSSSLDHPEYSTSAFVALASNSSESLFERSVPVDSVSVFVPCSLGSAHENTL